MRRISYWAKHNTLKARWLIVLLEILLLILAVRLGLLLLHSGFRLPGIAMVLPLSIFSAAHFIARYRIAFKQRNNGYWRQRLSFFLMGLSMFLLTAFLVSSEKLVNWNTYSSLSGSEGSMLVRPAPTAGVRLFAKQADKAARLLRHRRKNDGLKALYILLIIFGGLFLLYLVAVLSCSLSCNGNGALALVVLLLGGGGLIFLCVRLMQRILKGKSSKNTEPALGGNA